MSEANFLKEAKAAALQLRSPPAGAAKTADYKLFDDVNTDEIECRQNVQ